MSAAFLSRHRLRFGHVDAAGIGYYPRYFEICDAAIEDWTEEVLGVSRRMLHLDMNLALPTVDLHASFSKPSRLGEWLDIAIVVGRVGRTSVVLTADVTSGSEGRFLVTYTQVLTNMQDMRSEPWPQEWRMRLISNSKQETFA